MVSTRSGGRAPATEVGSDEGAGITPSESFLDQLVHGVVAELAKEQSASGALDRSGSGSAAGASDLPELDSLYWKPEVRLSGIPRSGDPSTSAPSGASLAKQVRRVAGSKCVLNGVCVCDWVGEKEGCPACMWRPACTACPRSMTTDAMLGDGAMPSHAGPGLHHAADAADAQRKESGTGRQGGGARHHRQVLV